MSVLPMIIRMWPPSLPIIRPIRSPAIRPAWRSSGPTKAARPLSGTSSAMVTIGMCAARSRSAAATRGSSGPDRISASHRPPCADTSAAVRAGSFGSM